MAPGHSPSCARGMVPLLLLQGLLLAFLCLSLPPLVPAPAAKATDIFVSNCTQIPDPPPNGFLRWSDPGTWTPLGFTGVPGVGALVNANVTIPCGMAVLLDSAVPMLNLTVLTIRGFLKVEDPATPRVYRVFACFVLVEGQLTIGSATNQFKSKITFTLMPNPVSRQNWGASGVWPAEPAFPRSMGHKPFAVVGGQVRLHGMPGGAATPSWLRLNATARQGDFHIVVEQDVSQLWPVGSSIAISSTDFDLYQAEEFIITGYDSDPRGTIITLNNRLLWNHWGEKFGIPDGFGGFLDERAEVALLTRNIVITGLDEPPPFQFQGGHFIVFMTPVPQFIEGVEFWLMGQQGILGRYNIHFHVCGDDQGRSVVRKNAMHDSKQRCVVLHTTDNVTVDSNVAFNTSGHCYMVEEGGEMDNTFINNLGFMQRAVVNLIADDESDNSPSTFWITNMNNNYINNVAGGSDNSGYWTELKPNVRGMSLNIPRINGLIPRNSMFGNITGNVAHSNRGPGWRFYPKGVDPRSVFDVNSTVPSWQWTQVRGVIKDLFVWKHPNLGVFMHNSQNVVMDGLVSADNQWGIELNGVNRATVQNSRFLALSPNPGTPDRGQCQETNSGWPFRCAPISGCSLTTDPRNWRNRMWTHWLAPTFGIALDAPSQFSDGRAVHTLTNNRFAGFEPTCGRAIGAHGFGISGPMNNRWWWAANQGSSGVRLSSNTSTAVWFVPPNYVWPFTAGQTPTTNPFFEQQTNFVWWDRDGSITGGNGGYLIANRQDLLPPVRVGVCTPTVAAASALSCPNMCYRTLQFIYNEDGYLPSTGFNRTRGEFSYMILRRVEDNVTHIVDGNANDTMSSSTQRLFWFNAYAPATYEVTIVPGRSNPNFWPSSMQVSYDDAGGCGAPITLRLLTISSAQWNISTSDAQFWSPCPGVNFTGQSQPWPVQYQYVCHRYRQVLQLTMLGNMDTTTSINLGNSGQRVMPCRLPMRCGVVGSGDFWFYSTTGLDLKPALPGAMGFQVPGFNQASFLYARGFFCSGAWCRTVIPQGNSTAGYVDYYRKNFTLTNTACYGTIFLDFMPYNGFVAWLNNVEIFRYNLPAGNVTNMTISLTTPPWTSNPPPLTTAVINITATNASFVEGTNFVAFETHAVSSWVSTMAFDARVSLLYSAPACTGASIMPEVCDGLDNNFDGLVDIDPATGRVFTRPCWTSCGTGIETCINGAFQNCTAPPTVPETCNGRDDDCDGLIDDGLPGTQMDCAAGSVCFRGQCLVQGPLTVPVPVFPRRAGGWNYLDKGWPWQSYPQWFNGRFSTNPNDTTIRQFMPGVAPFATAAYNFTALGWTPSTTLTRNTNNDIYYFFLKNFTLTAAEAASTWSLSLNTRRDNAAIVWSNGVELIRSNLPATFNAATNQYTFAPSGTCAQCWYPNNATRNTGFASGAVKSGNNWVAAQVTQQSWMGSVIHFDMELIRNVMQSCAALPGSPATCVRNPPNDTTFFQFGSQWKYLDLNYSLPAFSWIEPGFDDSAWPAGNGPLGVQSWTTTRLNMNRTMRQAYYFRRTFNVADASCHYNYTFQIKALDGAVVYVNGVEAFRFQWQSQVPWVLPTSFASTNWPGSGVGNVTLSGGWLVNGPNTIAAEIHPSTQNTNNWYFDLALTGQREGVDCTPLPP